MIPAQAATQKTRGPAMPRYVERALGATLADVESDQGSDRDRREPADKCPLAGNRREVDAEDCGRHEQYRQDPAEVVDRIGRLVDVTRDIAQRHEHRH